MGRFGVVNVPGGRWRAYAGPTAALLAVTLAIALVRDGLRGGHHSPSASGQPPATRQAPFTPPKAPHHRIYVVRAGDTIEAISKRTGVPQARILALNPKVSPTALFIGERLRLS